MDRMTQLDKMIKDEKAVARTLNTAYYERLSRLGQEIDEMVSITLGIARKLDV